jgi:hypothetical protein
MYNFHSNNRAVHSFIQTDHQSPFRFIFVSENIEVFSAQDEMGACIIINSAMLYASWWFERAERL